MVCVWIGLEPSELLPGHRDGSEPGSWGTCVVSTVIPLAYVARAETHGGTAGQVFHRRCTGAACRRSRGLGAAPKGCEARRTEVEGWSGRPAEIDGQGSRCRRCTSPDDKARGPLNDAARRSGACRIAILHKERSGGGRRAEALREEENCRRRTDQHQDRDERRDLPPVPPQLRPNACGLSRVLT